VAAARGYLPADVPLVKQIAALSGDTVCAAGLQISINGSPAAVVRAADARGRPLPTWSGCRRLGPRDVFLLMAHVPDSFDGRYFGVVTTAAIIGRLAPL
jgi:conjugative transfer signal peptidase TraF